MKTEDKTTTQVKPEEGAACGLSTAPCYALGAAQYGTLEIDLFDNTNGNDTCVSCNTFGNTWIYCPVFNHIMKDENVVFDETGELNRCELFSKAQPKLDGIKKCEHEDFERRTVMDLSFFICKKCGHQWKA